MESKCTICSRNVVLVDSQIGLYRCRSCGHMFTLNNRPDEEVYTEEYFSEKHKNWFSNPDYKLFDCIYNVLNKIVKLSSNSRFLDVGCGKGDFLRRMRLHIPAAEFYGIDIAECTALDINFIKGDIMMADIKRVFDVISALAVIEHVKDPHSFLKKLKSLSAPGGAIIISTINNNSFIYKLARLLNKIGLKGAYRRLYDKHHLQHFTKTSLNRLLGMYDLKAVYSRRLNYPLKSVDVPGGGIITRNFYLPAVVVIFFLQGVFNNGISQLVICKKGGKA